METTMTLGRRIAQLRKEKELKQDDLAQMLDVSAQAVSKWENDQTCPDISLLPRLASPNRQSALSQKHKEKTSTI